MQLAPENWSGEVVGQPVGEVEGESQEPGPGPQGLRAPAAALPQCFEGQGEEQCLLAEDHRHQQPKKVGGGAEEAAGVTCKARWECSGPFESF